MEARLASARRVASGMLHEIRNVLNPIVSAAFLLEANANDPAKVHELATRIEGFAKGEARIAAKMKELLDKEAAGEQGDSRHAGVPPAPSPHSNSA
jgi:nitrogen-specific signal transduction histidine kinase